MTLFYVFSGLAIASVAVGGYCLLAGKRAQHWYLSESANVMANPNLTLEQKAIAHGRQDARVMILRQSRDIATFLAVACTIVAVGAFVLGDPKW